MKRLGFYLLITFFWVIPQLSWALPPPIVQHKSRVLWNHTLDYQLKIVADASLVYDGESSLSREQDNTIYHVMLNTAFLEKEATQLFFQFKKLSSTRLKELLPAEKDLLGLEDALLSQRGLLTPKHRQTLTHLQKAFEFLAWYKTYQNCFGPGISENKALARFVQLFSTRRMHTIEVHELAHLIDLKQQILGKDLQKASELNAYYTELFYGGNPYDTLAHALSGLSDEVRQNKSIDFSREKVLVLLRFVKTTDYHKMNYRSAMQECCLVKLLNYQSNRLAKLGKALYEGNFIAQI